MTADTPRAIYVSVLIFPLAFMMNAAYQRREGTLSHVAEFKASCLSLYLNHRCWQFDEAVPHDFIRCSCNAFSELFASVRAYLTAESEFGKAGSVLCPCCAPPHVRCGPNQSPQEICTCTDPPPPRLLLSVRPTPRGEGGWVWQNFRVGGCPTTPPPPGVGWDFVGALGSIEPVPLLSFFCCRFHVTCLFMVCLHGIAYHVCMPHAHKGARMHCHLCQMRMVVHLCEKLGLLYCMSQLGTWVGGWVGGCHLSVCGYAKILGGWVPELTPRPPPPWLSKTLTPPASRRGGSEGWVGSLDPPPPTPNPKVTGPHFAPRVRRNFPGHKIAHMAPRHIHVPLRCHCMP